MTGKKEAKALCQRIEGLEEEIRRLKYKEQINQTLLEITNAVTTTPNLYDLYRSIHHSLDRLIHIPNLYISIYNKEKGVLYFPYSKDEWDSDSYQDIRSFMENSLTGEVILTKKPLFLDETALKNRERENKIVGTVPKIWLGVPLLLGDMVIGVLAIQHYTDPDAYAKKDLDLLVSVSRQIATAIDRKRLNETLKENEERYRTLSENSHDIIMRFDKGLRHLYVNPAVARIGFSPDQFIGKTHRELGFPEDLIGLWEKTLRVVFKTGSSKRIEFNHPEGIWIDWLLCPEFDGEGAVRTVITFARDITQKKQVEFQSLCYDRINKIIINSEDMEKMLNDILDSMLDIFNCDRAWILFPCDPEAESYSLPFMRHRPDWPQKVGYSVKITEEARELLKEILTSEDPIVYDPLSQKKVRKYIQETYFVKSQMVAALLPKIGKAWEVGLHQCSRERIWTTADQLLFKGICRRMADGLSSMLLFRELSRAKHYIENVIDSMPSVLLGVDVHGRITQWNFKAEQETGVMAKEAIGQEFYRLFPHLGQLSNKIKAAIEDAQIIEETKIQRVVDGKSIFENITIFPLKEISAKEAVIRIDDITDKRKIEEMMVQSEKMLSIGGLAAGMAHEINNPLAGMMQNAQLVFNRLSRNLPENEKIAKEAGTTIEAIKYYMEKRNILVQLGYINESGKQAAKIVQNMLSFAKKAEEGRTYEHLPRLMDRTLELAQNDYDLKKRYNFKHIRIIRTESKDFPLVRCEPGKIQQAFFNIIKNGAEAMQGISEQAEFDIRFFVEDRMAVIEIRDNGPGIAEDLKKRIFEPFFSTKSPDKGSGLGLSVAFFIIVEDHKGKFSVESSPGSGAAFIVRLPLYD
jgi:PAS domain S-box-containing protein